MDFAFFFVHFGTSRREYNLLTPREKAFIRRAYEDKVVSESTMIRNAVLNATYNANRKKGKPFRDLWRRQALSVDSESMKNDIRLIEDIEKKETGWIEKIRRAQR